MLECFPWALRGRRSATRLKILTAVVAGLNQCCGLTSRGVVDSNSHGRRRRSLADVLAGKVELDFVADLERVGVVRV